MAMIDYGAIAFKNGKLISTDMFTPMQSTCGFSDRNTPLPNAPRSFAGNFFVVLGNRHFLIGFYKTYICCWEDYGIETDKSRCRYTSEYFDSSGYINGVDGKICSAVATVLLGLQLNQETVIMRPGFLLVKIGTRFTSVAESISPFTEKLTG